jgi:hypothetical protein
MRFTNRPGVDDRLVLLRLNARAGVASRRRNEGRCLEFSSKGDRARIATKLGLRRQDIGGREPMRRRTILLLLGAGASSLAVGMSLGQGESSPTTLLNAPLEVQGEWGKSAPGAATSVISRMREVCLAGVKLLSDQQPTRLRVENHADSSPSIWLHNDSRRIAWIIVNIGERDWSKLAYQFGHELGHVLANSWGPNSKPQPPCQWLEEALVEAFSLRGLGKLADSWEQRPLFKNDAPFANAIRQYRRGAIENYEKIGSNEMRDSGVDAWFRQHRSALEDDGGITGPAQAAVPTMLHELETDTRSIEDMGALNRWAERSAVPIERYLRLWKRSCDEIGAAGELPKRLVDLLDVSCAI